VETKPFLGKFEMREMPAAGPSTAAIPEERGIVRLTSVCHHRVHFMGVETPTQPSGAKREGC
jgi:hypothetical protein